MKKVFLFSLLIFSALNLLAQSKDYYIKSAPLHFTIPNDKWMPLPEKKSKHSTLLHFKRLGLKDSVGRKAFPEIVIIIEPVPAHTDLTPYSITKQKPYKDLKNYKVEKVFTESDNMMRLHYAIGQKASYEDAYGVKHTFYFIHAIKHHHAIQVILDIPSDLFLTYEEELTSVIRSLE